MIRDDLRQLILDALEWAQQEHALPAVATVESCAIRAGIGNILIIGRSPV